MPKHAESLCCAGRDENSLDIACSASEGTLRGAPPGAEWYMSHAEAHGCCRLTISDQYNIKVLLMKIISSANVNF